jgi:hypothetical protein
MDVFAPIKNMIKQLKRLNATKKKVLNREPLFDTTNLDKEISNLQKEIAYCKNAIVEYNNKKAS